MEITRCAMLSGCKDNWSYTSYITWSVILSKFKFANLLHIFCSKRTLQCAFNIFRDTRILTKDESSETMIKNLIKSLSKMHGSLHHAENWIQIIQQKNLEWKSALNVIKLQPWTFMTSKMQIMVSFFDISHLIFFEILENNRLNIFP